jgi:hypothetical protein
MFVIASHNFHVLQGVHTLWQDDVVMYTDQPSSASSTNSHSDDAPPVPNPAIVQAYQELARQKLLYSKDAPAYMLQLFCDLTKPPLPGDEFGRCTRAKAKETGMLLCIYALAQMLFLAVQAIREKNSALVNSANK